MAVHVEAVIDYILHDAAQDMGTGYEPERMSIRRQRVTRNERNNQLDPQQEVRGLPLEMFWNEGSIETTYSMEAQGVYARTNMEVHILSQSDVAVTRAVAAFEDALIGLLPEGAIAHHNISGTIVDYAHMQQYQRRNTLPAVMLGDYYYGSYQLGETGFQPIDDDMRPVHLISKVVVTGKSITADAATRGWLGVVKINLEIANKGLEGQF